MDMQDGHLNEHDAVKMNPHFIKLLDYEYPRLSVFIIP